VNYVKREANEVAHKIANEALFLMDEQVYKEEKLVVHIYERTA
jgi:hypothetical protein